MAERRGFWGDRPRRGADDARVLAAERIHDLRRLPYAALRRLADEDPVVEQRATLPGDRVRRRTVVQRYARGGEEELRITVQVLRPGRFARLNPLAEQAVLASPDGEMVGEWTMASEGNTPRRYDFPSYRRRER